ncbi:hypothetical protein BJN44_11075 [Tessaracoccus sp. ZS01]|nr:hypothetical protein BJN44_11075 [Tessaracoccus sp. ZS01]
MTSALAATLAAAQAWGRQLAGYGIGLRTSSRPVPRRTSRATAGFDAVLRLKVSAGRSSDGRLGLKPYRDLISLTFNRMLET